MKLEEMLNQQAKRGMKQQKIKAKMQSYEDYVKDDASPRPYNTPNVVDLKVDSGMTCDSTNDPKLFIESSVMVDSNLKKNIISAHEMDPIRDTVVSDDLLSIRDTGSGNETNSIRDTSLPNDLGIIRDTNSVDEVSPIRDTNISTDLCILRDTSSVGEASSIGDTNSVDEVSPIKDTNLSTDLCIIRNTSSVGEASSIGDTSLPNNLSIIIDTNSVDEVSSIGDTNTTNEPSIIGDTNSVDEVSSIRNTDFSGDLGSIKQVLFTNYGILQKDISLGVVESETQRLLNDSAEKKIEEEAKTSDVTEYLGTKKDRLLGLEINTKIDSIENSYLDLNGNAKKIVDEIANICLINGDLTTNNIEKNIFSKNTGVKLGAIKTTACRLKEKGILKYEASKGRNSSWKFTLHPEIFEQYLKSRRGE